LVLISNASEELIWSDEKRGGCVVYNDWILFYRCRLRSDGESNRKLSVEKVIVIFRFLQRKEVNSREPA